MKRKVKVSRVLILMAIVFIASYLLYLGVSLFTKLNRGEVEIIYALKKPGFNLEPCVYELPKEEDEFIFYETKEQYIQEEVLNAPIYESTVNESGLISLGVFKLTGYDDCIQCQGEWVGTTATGVVPTINNTIAVDPDVIPLGSYVWINGIRYHAEDVGGGVKGNHIDIFVGSHDETYAVTGQAEVFIENY